MLSFGSLRGAAGAVVPPGADRSAELLLAQQQQQQQGPVLQECGYYDVEQVERITHALLITLATACVEKTAGDPFNHPAAVLPEVKKEMLEYLQKELDAHASNTAAAVAPEAAKFVQPYKVAEDMLEGFVRSKKNLFSRVSSKILHSEKKDDKIEDFVAELDRGGVWMVGRRESMAKALLKRVDRSLHYHCEMRFETSEEMAEHKAVCTLRPMTCENEGCGGVFSAAHADSHDASCPFKMLPCEQGCKSRVQRGDMDKHCVTVCPMKLVNCPFRQVGCTATVPQGVVEQHCTDLLSQHLIFLLHNVSKQEVSVSGQAQRILLLEKALSLAQRSEAVDVGSVTLTVKEQEAKIKALEQEVKKLRQELKATDVSAEVLQLRREIRNVQKQVETSSAASVPPQ